MYQKVDLTEEVNFDKDAVGKIKKYFKETLSQSEVEDSGRSIASSYSYQPKVIGAIDKSKLAKGRDDRMNHTPNTNITAPISPKHLSTGFSSDDVHEEGKLREFRKISKSRIDEEDLEGIGRLNGDLSLENSLAGAGDRILRNGVRILLF